MHSGDSSCQIPPATLSDEELDTIEDIAVRLARRLGVVGLLNLQLAVKDERIWVLEANPRASRTVPFVSKVIGVSLARVATLVLTGRTHRRPARRRRAAERPAPLPAPSLHEREGRRASVRPVPGRRHGARARDEVDRARSWGSTRTAGWRWPRRWSRPGTPCRPRARCSSASPTATSARSCSPRSASPTSGSGSSRRAGRRACWSAPGSRWHGWPRSARAPTTSSS